MYEFLIHSLTITAIYAIVALSLNVQVGFAGLFNFGQIVFVGIGAYGFGIGMHAGLSVISSALTGVGIAALLGFFMARLGRNLGADYWAIATLALAEIFRVIALNENWLTGGAQGLGNIPNLFANVQVPLNRYYFLFLAVISVFMVLWLNHRIQAGRFGRALRLMREQPALAESCGYDLVSLKSKTMVTAASIAAFAGVLLASYIGYVGPDYMMAAETFMIWTMIMIGGIGNNLGVVVGAIIVQALYLFVPFLKDILSISSDLSGALRLGLVGAGLLICLLIKPEGLIPERLRKS